MKLKAQPIGASAFALFGQVVSIPQAEPTASLEGMDFWAGVATLPDLGAAYGVGYATQAKRPFRQTSVERHLKTPELLMPVDGDMIVVVGPPDYLDEPQRLPAPERFVAFRVAEGQGVIFKPGVWHWAPFAVDATIRLLVIFAAGTPQSDAVVVAIPPDGVLEIEL